MVSKDLLEILACPSCKGDLDYDPQADTLTCRNKHCPECGMPVDDNGKCQDEECGKVSHTFVALRYRVEDDIPNMLIYEAEKLPI
ncbi:hypothetical protein A2V82_04635 [candidate division KSB1 bacterium RBG_16_48_16]|nr:MAG: hypothetical protein A2V82_04635 [candidate division KSB1 bacterium RBG_16_48_16]